MWKYNFHLQITGWLMRIACHDDSVTCFSYFSMSDKIESFILWGREGVIFFVDSCPNVLSDVKINKYVIQKKIATQLLLLFRPIPFLYLWNLHCDLHIKTGQMRFLSRVCNILISIKDVVFQKKKLRWKWNYIFHRAAWKPPEKVFTFLQYLHCY